MEKNILHKGSVHLILRGGGLRKRLQLRNTVNFEYILLMPEAAKTVFMV